MGIKRSSTFDKKLRQFKRPHVLLIESHSSSAGLGESRIPSFPCADKKIFSLVSQKSNKMSVILVSMIAALVTISHGCETIQQEQVIGNAGNQYTLTVYSNNNVEFKCDMSRINIDDLPRVFSGKDVEILRLTILNCTLPEESLQNIAEALGAIRIKNVDLVRVPLITRNHLEQAQLRKIQVSDSDVTTDAFAQQSRCILIDVKSSKFQLSEGSFSGADNLDSLSLVDFEITQIPHGIFKETPKLVRLNLGNNLLPKVTNLDFEGLGSLRELYIGENQLTSLPNDFFKFMPNVTTFRVTRNPLREITREVLRDSKVSQLFIDHNKVPLEIPPRALADLPLINVNLVYNNINSLPEDFLDGSSGVQELVLSHNNLEELPAGVFINTPHLRELIISNNQLRVLLPETLAPLLDLRTLYIDNNSLTEIAPATFFFLNELRSLSIEKNNLHSVAPDAFPTYLNTLILDDNQLTTLETTPLQLYRLHLQNNLFTSIPSLWVETFPDLSQLFLNNNSFTEITESDMATLAHYYKTYIFLDDNKIETIHVGPNTRVPSSISLHNAPLRCDCELLEFATQLRNYSDKGAVCAEPEALRGTSVTAVPLTDFVC